jgi:thiamine-monophosphate kinase
MPDPNSGDTEGARPPGTVGGEKGGGEFGEFAAIGRMAGILAARTPAPPPGEVWIGDDAAVLRPPTGFLLLATDVAVSGVHADPAWLSAADLGWRAMVASVSDMAAMGGRPRHAVVAVAGPPDSDLEGLYAGIAAAAEAFACPVVGGDLSAAPVLTVAVAMTGAVEDGPPPVRRAGGRPGDRLYVTGPLGASAAGLRALRARRGAPEREATAVAAGAEPAVAAELAARHRRPVPRLAEGETARRAGASAMVDVSDGLAADLGHLADASGVGFRLDRCPVHPGATLEDALGGGEDYELVIALPAGVDLAGAFARAGLAPPIPIGWCTEDPAERTLAGEPMGTAGFEHDFRPGTSGVPR